MAKNLKATVYLQSSKGVVAFGPGDVVPGWAHKLITNPDVWDGPADENDAGTPPAGQETVLAEPVPQSVSPETGEPEA
ncbi:hypothetical protein GCM10009569_34900 [Arthrobacter russicus]|uniref:Uncharacterized protein n=1 Tax=Arthrobacter russicus TaxID=172040 RepID=A0ABU1JEP6_9MICC|nr:hypothetical protein [Arthrobacter russicus]